MLTMVHLMNWQKNKLMCGIIVTIKCILITATFQWCQISWIS